MPLGKPKTIGEELLDQLWAEVLSATNFADPSSFQVRSYVRRIDALARADAVEASIARAVLDHFIGDIEGAVHWVRNAGRLQPGLATAKIVGTFCANLSYFSRAAALAHQVDTRDADSPFVRSSCTAGAYSQVERLAAGIEIADEETLHSVHQARSAIVVLTKLQIPEERVQAVLDVAGEVLRENRLFFVGSDPIIHASADDIEGPSLLCQLEVNVDAERAMDMTDEVIDRLVARGLLVYGMSFSFIPSAA